MTFEISKISNSYLRDVAIIIDDGNGIIQDEEISVFLDKVKQLGIIDAGLCSQIEYSEILNYNFTETKTVQKNNDIQQNYITEYEAEIEKELNKRNLERTDENVKNIIEIIKNKKELNIQIKIQEVKIKKLNEKLEDVFFKRKLISTVAGIIPTAIAGAAIGFKVGALFGPAGMVVGAFLGNTIGAAVGGFCGYKIGSATISEEDKKAAQEEIKKEIAAEEETLKKLREEYEKLG